MSKERPAFQLGLALSGAVAAGAYTAGVLDFLLEALDAWHEDSQSAHDIVINTVAGASAGSVCAALFARMLGKNYVPMGAEVDPKTTANPLYAAWVDRFGIADLMSTEDLRQDQRILSLLNTLRLDRVFQQVLTLPADVRRRRYVADPLRLRFTVTNLRGVPFSAPLSSNGVEALAMVRHDDQLRYAVAGLGSAHGRVAGEAGDWRHEQSVTLASENDSCRAWQELAEAALASAAIPLLLRVRRLHKAPEDYVDLPLIAQNMDARYADGVKVSADWGQSPPAGHFLAADGGLLHNEPLELARQALHNDGALPADQSGGARTDSATVLIDPFVGQEAFDAKPLWEAEIGQVGRLVLRSLIDQSRYRPLDLMLAAEPEVYNRFVVAPDRGDMTRLAQGRALAGGAMKGFGGYLSDDFRRHDFLLGRRNCQQFLRKWFTLPATNPLFAAWTNDKRERYTIANTGSTDVQLPIIPLVGTAAKEQPLPPWPKGTYDTAAVRPLLKQRLDALIQASGSHLPIPQRLLISAAWKLMARRKTLDWFDRFVTGSLEAHDLL